MKKVLVTGGGGFVGRALVKALLARGIQCRILGRNSYPDLVELGAVCLSGDLKERGSVMDAACGCDTVFHVGSLAGIWGTYQCYYDTNVVGTRNVVDVCLEQNITRLVYTSTPSVVFNRHDIAGGDEMLPHAGKFLCHYAATKSIAEKLVLAVDQNRLCTVALRPHLIWGPGDPHLIPRLLDRARKGRLRRVGTGQNMVDITYIDNVVHAHLLAADALWGDGRCSGKAYFIGQERPVNLWSWVYDLLQKRGIPLPKGAIPFRVASLLGALLEGGYTVAGIQKEPPMTRFLAEQLAKSHYFSHKRAEDDFGYRPVVSLEEGSKRLIEWLRENEKDR